MNRGTRAIMFIIFFIFGLLINLQFKGIIMAKPNNGATAKELAAQLELEKSENAKLMEQLANLEAERDMLWKNIGDTLNNQQINELLKKKDYEYFRAGLTSVKGSGIVITMEDAPAKGELDIEIKDVAYDSRKVKKGSLFVCIDGMTTDGHKYIPSAL